jgi:hypothetical protein
VINDDNDDNDDNEDDEDDEDDEDVEDVEDALESAMSDIVVVATIDIVVDSSSDVVDIGVVVDVDEHVRGMHVQRTGAVEQSCDHRTCNVNRYVFDS